ncbi:FKBP-type peptidyl-prolyl cis-trans isomerase SlyD [Alteromonadaceae bacterium Bs31]|nr:FKBP-type peptidyl-prolyl cis-trans isomerase SlyD [Alteromonadaceae bacterium Bs31]
MKIAKDCVVSFHYQLSEVGGEALESSEDGVPMAYLHGHGNLLKGLEEALIGLASGDKKSVTLPPEKAYGERRDNAMQKVPIKHLIGKYKRLMPNMLVKVNTEKGPVNARVIKPGKFMVELDTNHPFAGKTLEFAVEIKSVREATEEELAHGHAHGEGGHQH